MVGAKTFAKPKGLGMVLSHRCYFGLLKEGSQPSLDHDFVNAAYESIEGERVWVWSVPPYEDRPQPTEFYAAQVDASYFVMTDNRQDFQEIVRALKAAGSAVPSPINLFDWGNFSSHQYWGYRLVRRDGASDADAAALTKLTPDVKAITFFADISRRQSFIRVLSSDPSMKTRPSVLPKADLQQFQTGRPGVWETAAALTQDKHGSDAMLWFFYMLGFGVNA